MSKQSELSFIGTFFGTLENRVDGQHFNIGDTIQMIDSSPTNVPADSICEIIHIDRAGHAWAYHAESDDTECVGFPEGSPHISDTAPVACKVIEESE